MRDSSTLKYIVFGAILVIYLDWGRLFGDFQRILTIMITETQEETTHD